MCKFKQSSRKVTKKSTKTNENAFNVKSLKKLKNNFNKDEKNKIVQNSLCTNDLFQVSEVREYMQSRDRYFSHIIYPKLVPTDQNSSGRCWLFSLLNVLRHEFVRDFHLPLDFEFSESYLSFYEKIEKCNYFLTNFMDKKTIDVHDLEVKNILMGGLFEGGYWSSSVNLIKKYGLVPKSCFLESYNSSNTDTVDNIISTKLREFALAIVNENNENRKKLKDKMMEQIYDILSKMLGTPINPTEKFEWNYVPKQDLLEQIQLEEEIQESGKYKILQLKKTMKLTPLEFYKKFITKDLDEYLSFSNDPRNEYYKYYESSENDIVIEGKKSGYYNLPIEEISMLCVKSLIDNTPVQFNCDVCHYFHYSERLFDTKCFNYDLLFKTNFNNLSKKEMLNTYQSYANHAMILTGFDMDKNGKILKFVSENSWGAGKKLAGADDYYTISYDWFKKYAYDVVIHKDYVDNKLYDSYYKAKENKIILPLHDIMCSYY